MVAHLSLGSGRVFCCEGAERCRIWLANGIGKSRVVSRCTTVKWEKFATCVKKAERRFFDLVKLCHDGLRGGYACLHGVFGCALVW